ncbi:MAG: NUDIX hydrolase [Nitrospirota bacterium]
MDRNTVKITSKKTLFEGKFLKFILTTYIDSSGKTREWESFERINCEGIVVIIPWTEKDETLLIRQFRPPVNGYVVEFPAGLNDKGGSLEDAARRELLEETGYSAEKMIYLTEGPLSSGASGEILTAFLATGLRFEGFAGRDEAEEMEVLKIPVRDLDSRLSALRSAGNYIDLKIFGLIELARKYLPF